MITLECNYSKKLGLPGYSSHQFSITLRTEIADLNQVHAESARLYTLLQQGVDASIQQVGFLPGDNSAVPIRRKDNGNGAHETWACSDKQKDLILKIVDEHKMDKQAVEQLAQDRFGKGVRQLNKLEASGLIEELLEQNGQPRRRAGRLAPAGGGR